MTLTGLPLIITTALLTVLVLAGTILLWSRFGRWRLLTRSLGVVLAQALVVATVGLIANRSAATPARPRRPRPCRRAASTRR
jgi:hypothetical protein